MPPIFRSMKLPVRDSDDICLMYNDSFAVQKKGKKIILLVLSGTGAENNALNYALNSASRNRSAIEVLSLMPNQLTLELINNSLESKDMDFQSISINKASGCIKTALVEYTRNRHDIDFVIIESETALKTECGKNERKLNDTLLSLKCPLVIVSKLKNSYQGGKHGV